MTKLYWTKVVYEVKGKNENYFDTMHVEEARRMANLLITQS